MDARTLHNRTELGLQLFDVLRRQGVFGPRLREPDGTGVHQAGTTVYSLDDGEPVFSRRTITSVRPEVAGYVDIALQPWLGWPVIAVNLDARWDPQGFQDSATLLGYRCRRWVSYAGGRAALQCNGVLLDPYRAKGGELFVVPPREAVTDWGLSEERQDQNRDLYDEWNAALAMGAATLRAAEAQVQSNALELCAMSDHPRIGHLCLSRFAERRILWCVPAALEMAIEYLLAQKTEGRYQGILARSLGLYGGTGLGDARRTLQAVPDSTNKAVTITEVDVTLTEVRSAIDQQQPLALLTSNHAFLVFGYSGVLLPRATHLEPTMVRVVNPWGRGLEFIPLAAHGSYLFRLQRAPSPREGGLGGTRHPAPMAPA